jgi:molybdopterin biosynthesis enzyme MoaB
MKSCSGTSSCEFVRQATFITRSMSLVKKQKDILCTKVSKTAAATMMVLILSLQAQMISILMFSVK